MRVALFATCLVDRFMPDAGFAAARLLRSLGIDVIVPTDQTCCGQPAYTAGHHAEARQVAEHTGRVFADAEYVVLPSGSCAAMLRHHYAELLGSGQAGAGDPIDLGPRTWELSEFLVRVLGIEKLGDGLRGRRVAFHHGCHALRELRLRDAPLLLLEQAGADIVEWTAAEECCGFGGLFATRLPEVSAAMADRKLDTLFAERSTGSAARAPDVLTSTDAGCLLQLQGRMSQRGENLPVQHLALLLEQATNGRA